MNTYKGNLNDLINLISKQKKELKESFKSKRKDLNESNLENGNND
jgi:hypothetical protein